MALALRRPRTHFFPRPALAPANFRTGTLNDCLVVVAPGGPSSWLNESHPMTVLAFAEGAFAVLSVDLQMDLGSSLDVIARETWQDVQAQLATVGPRKVVFLGYCSGGWMFHKLYLWLIANQLDANVWMVTLAASPMRRLHRFTKLVNQFYVDSPPPARLDWLEKQHGPNKWPAIYNNMRGWLAADTPSFTLPEVKLLLHHPNTAFAVGAKDGNGMEWTFAVRDLGDASLPMALEKLFVFGGVDHFDYFNSSGQTNYWAITEIALRSALLTAFSSSLCQGPGDKPALMSGFSSDIALVDYHKQCQEEKALSRL